MDDGMNGDGSDVFTSSLSRDPRYSAVFEDDGTVSYGYLLYNGKIIGDVWLYNVCDAPQQRPWTDCSQRPPFLNPEEFVELARFAPVAIAGEVSFVWSYAEDGLPISVEIWIRGELHARIAPGSKPGWCRLAAKDGPLALKL